MKLPVPLHTRGFLKFTLTLENEWRNGLTAAKSDLILFRIDDFCNFHLRNDVSHVNLLWEWKENSTHKDKPKSRFEFEAVRFPPHTPLRMLYTWDADQGYFDGYMNGIPLRIPESKFSPWDLTPAHELAVSEGPFQITDIESGNSYLSPQKLGLNSSPDDFAPILSPDPAIIAGAADLYKRKGAQLYDSAVEDPAFQQWIHEGPVRTEYANGWAKLTSTALPSQGTNLGHIVSWCPREFPHSFVAEWEIQLESEAGLCIVFFAALGINGESIFNPSLSKRDGDFSQYIHGDIKNYHISYYANTPFNPGRPQANLRKNNRFFLLSQGSTPMSPGTRDVHSICLIKDANILFLSIDGIPVIAYKDQDERHYAAPHGKGHIGLRQMRWTIAKYRHFRVSELAPR